MVYVHCEVFNSETELYTQYMITCCQGYSTDYTLTLTFSLSEILFQSFYNSLSIVKQMNFIIQKHLIFHTLFDTIL